jgi:hypothetical protein
MHIPAATSVGRRRENVTDSIGVARYDVTPDAWQNGDARTVTFVVHPSARGGRWSGEVVAIGTSGHDT